MVFIVEYTNEDMTGNQVLTMEIEADDLDSAWSIVDEHYTDIAVDNVYPVKYGFYR